MTVAHWFADLDEDAEPPNVWRPRLHTRVGHQASLLNVWFESPEACEWWMREFVIGVGWGAPDDDECVGCEGPHHFQCPLYTGRGSTYVPTPLPPPPTALTARRKRERCQHEWTERGTPGDDWRECWLCGETEDA